MPAKKIHLPEKFVKLLEEYKKEHKMELIEQGITDDAELVRKLILVALKPWLEQRPDLIDKYLLE